MRSYTNIKPLKSIYQLPEYAQKYRAELDLKKVENELPASQQLAMMILLRSDLSKLIVGKLYQSNTIRCSERDFYKITKLGLAQKKPSGIGHQLSPIGRLKAQTLSYELAQRLEIQVPHRPSNVLHRRRKWIAGAMSEAGNA